MENHYYSNGKMSGKIRGTQRFIRRNIYSFQISILLACSQNRKDRILHFTLSVFSWHIIRIKPNINYVSNIINNLRFQIEMTLRHRDITELHLFLKIHATNTKRSFSILYGKVTFQYVNVLFCWQFCAKLLTQYFRSFGWQIKNRIIP